MRRLYRPLVPMLVLALAPGGAWAPVSAAAEAPSEAIPLRKDTPGWYTPELHERVLAAGPRGIPVPDEATVPSSALAVDGIRPGSWMVFPHWCTMNFVFRSRGRLFIGTAGHCTDRRGQRVTVFVGPDRLVNVGRVVRRVSRGAGRDFALVRIRPGVRRLVARQMALVGGPTGQYGGRERRPVLHVGHGVAIGTGGTPRAGVSLRWGRGVYAWAGAGAPGDSGSPVRIDGGRAAGNLTHLVVGGPDVAPRLVGTRIGRIMRMLGPRFRLLTTSGTVTPI